jgi:hypothetical protein
VRVKEKFGGLCIHVNHRNDAICQRIEAAIQKSFLPMRPAISPANCGTIEGRRGRR